MSEKVLDQTFLLPVAENSGSAGWENIATIFPHFQEKQLSCLGTKTAMTYPNQHDK